MPQTIHRKETYISLCDGAFCLEEEKCWIEREGPAEADRRLTTNLKRSSCCYCTKQSSNIRRFKLHFPSCTFFHTFLS